MALSRIALIQQLLRQSANRSPRVFPPHTSAQGAEASDQYAPHHPPAREASSATRPRVSNQRHTARMWLVETVLQRSLRKDPPTGDTVPARERQEASVVHTGEPLPRRGPGTGGQDAPSVPFQ
jgi:hypothetical protein